MEPQPGDFIVLCPSNASPGSRLRLVRLEADGSHHLVRVTFADAPGANARFEAIAASMASSAGTRAFRGTAGGPFAALDA